MKTITPYRNYNLAVKSKSWITMVLVAAIIIGIGLRIYGLNDKFYWTDEVHTSMRISGYSKEDVYGEIFQNQPIAAASLDQYKYPDQTSFVDTWQALTSRPEHPPLYYLMAKQWVVGWGNSAAAIRSLSVVWGVIAIGCIYWLSLLLLNSRLAAVLAAALIAVSPLHLLYAQEARQYSLWTVTVLLSTIALVEAVKRQKGWLAYSITLVFGLYSHLFFSLTVVAHAVYVFFLEGFKQKPQSIFTTRQPQHSWKKYLLATGGAYTAFLPWLIVIATNSDRANHFTRKVDIASFGEMVDKWLRNTNRVFFQADLGGWNTLLALIIAGCLVYLGIQTPKRVWLLIFSLVGVSSLSLIVPEFLGVISSVKTRYLIPVYLALQLAIAFTLSDLIQRRNWQKKLGIALTTLLILGGLAGSVAAASQFTSWSKSEKAPDYPTVAAAINQSSQPLIVSDTSPTYILELTNLISPQSQLLLLTHPQIPQIQGSYSNIFLFNPSENLLQQFQSQYQLNSVVDSKLDLWEVRLQP